MTQPKKPKTIGLYAGPGTGKSTTATAVFSELKQLGINCEYVSEYAKDATWERRGAKVFAAQEYLFAKQHFRMSRVAEEVDIIITDSPILLSLVYMPDGFGMPSLTPTIKEAYKLYDNLDIFLERNKPYNSKGRNQSFEQAVELDSDIKGVLLEANEHALVMPYGRNAIFKTIFEAAKRWGNDIPELHDFVPNFKPVLTHKELPPVGKIVMTDKGESWLVKSGTWYMFDHYHDTEVIVEAPRWWMSSINDEMIFGNGHE